MDLYLTSGEPGLTLQEMIDCDIKCGIEFEDGLSSLDSVVTSHDLNILDLSGMSNLEAEMDLKTFEPLFDPLDRLEDMEVVVMGDLAKSEQNSKLQSSPVHSNRGKTFDIVSEVASWMSLNSAANYNMDIEGSIMVDPSAVLPSAIIPKTKLEATSTSFVKPYISTSLSQEGLVSTTSDNSTLNIKTEQNDLLNGLSEHHNFSPEVSSNIHQNHSQSSATPINTQVILSSQASSISNGSKLISQSSFQNINTINTSISSNDLQQLGQYSNNTNGTLHSYYPHSQNGSSNRVGPYSTSNRSGTSANSASRSKPKYMRSNSPPPERTLPKPAYSYSCLIALALKNSLTGSLPVSEIYSFMCEHFPYFKTAPNGWKNSVRHNLSLNKCFEKIEKPIVSGSNQRKGCLWALCPSKAHKMDEEVIKWSKKDLQGIKDAMVHPENLESLERGEMKFESYSGAYSCSEDEEEEFEESSTQNLISAAVTGSTFTGTIVNCSVVNGTTVGTLITAGTGNNVAKLVQANPVHQRFTNGFQAKPTDGTLQQIKIINSLNTPIMAQALKQTNPHTRIITQPVVQNAIQTVSRPPNTATLLTQANVQMAKKQSLQQQQMQNNQLLRAQVRKSLIHPVATANIKTSSPEPEYVLPDLPDSTMSEINIQSNGLLIDDFGNEIKLEGEMGILNPPKNSPLILRKVTTMNQTASHNPIRSTPIQRSFVYSSQSMGHQPRLVLTNAKMSL